MAVSTSPETTRRLTSLRKATELCFVTSMEALQNARTLVASSVPLIWLSPELAVSDEIQGLTLLCGLAQMVNILYP